MASQAALRRFHFNLPYLIQAVQEGDPWMEQRYRDEAAIKILSYLRQEKIEADPRAIQFLRDSYCSLTVPQRQKLWKAIHSKRGRPKRSEDYEYSEHENDGCVRSSEFDINSLLAGLSNLTSGQFQWLSRTFAVRKGRPSLATGGQELQIKIGARVHQLIEERREAQKRGARLRGGGPYESATDDAMQEFQCSPRTLDRAYREFLWRWEQGIVDVNGNYVPSSPLDGDYGDSGSL